MQITLNQDEIHAAVEGYVRNQITIADNQSIDIDFTAGRGSNGLSATLDIRTNTTVSNKPKFSSRSVEEASEQKVFHPKSVDPVEASDDAEDETADDDEVEASDEDEAPKVNRESIFAKAKSA